VSLKGGRFYARFTTLAEAVKIRDRYLSELSKKAITESEISEFINDFKARYHIGRFDVRGTHSNRSSGHRNIAFIDGTTPTYRVKIERKGTIFLMSFDTLEEAVEARNTVLQRYHDGLDDWYKSDFENRKGKHSPRVTKSVRFLPKVREYWSKYPNASFAKVASELEIDIALVSKIAKQIGHQGKVDPSTSNTGEKHICFTRHNGKEVFVLQVPRLLGDGRYCFYKWFSELEDAIQLRDLTVPVINQLVNDGVSKEEMKASVNEFITSIENP
jgi:hypothetical protein